MANVSSSNGIEKCPKLRFQGFTIPWTEIEIGKAFQVTRGYVLPATVVRQDASEEYIYPVYSSQTKDNGLMGYYNDYLYENAITWTTDGANAGTVHYRSGKFYCTNVCGVLLSDEGNANRCVAEILGSVSKKYVSYVGNPKLMNNVMSEIKIYVPTIAEQKKIDDFISVIDQRIEKQLELIEHLKKYKRGVDASVFDVKRQHSEKELYGWGCVPFGDVVAINPKTPALPEHFIYIDLESVDFGRLQCLKYIDRKDAPSRAQRVLADSDVLFQMVRPYQKNNYFFKDIFDSPVVASTGYAQIRCLDCDPMFVFEQISSDYFSQEAMLRSTGTGYPAINSEGLAEIPFFLPPLPEQKKIGKFLSLLRTKIEYENGQLDVLNKLKTALLQQLFI